VTQKETGSSNLFDESNLANVKNCRHNFLITRPIFLAHTNLKGAYEGVDAVMIHFVGKILHYENE